ncbi:sushi domain-containing protein 5 [Gadus morhua]|uniref:Sushi domain-containing protein 5 n=1 Tax=Gadus morhua TaxID=8049 RepID=A0A8C5CI54_GADMO|nr:sushi domain-containing protein 5 [Gadus morhua]
MLDRYNIHDIVLSFLVGCMACLSLASVNNADGRVFTLDLRGSASLRGLRGAERACVLQNARLASGAELRRAVLECSFSACTRGWLHDGTVGTTDCRNAGSSLTAMEVRTENFTDHTAQLNAFCIKDTGVPCGDPPSFPSTRLQGQAGFELGDELLYVCTPGYRMPSGNTAFSLLCDSCGEWYGLVQMCLRDESETHVDYEDRFPEGYGALDHHSDPGEVPAEREDPPVSEEVHPAVFQQQQDPTPFTAGRGGQQRRDQQGEEAWGGEERSLHGAEGVAGGASQGAARGVRLGEDPEPGDVKGGVPLEQEQELVVRVGSDAASQATAAPVSKLSQKHMFWFPSEAFHEEGYPAPEDPGTQTPAADTDQSDESKEGHPDDDADDHHDEVGDHDDHEDDREDSRQQEDHDDSRHSDHDDHDDRENRDDGADEDVHDNSRQEEAQDEDLLDQHVKHYNPGQRDTVDRYSRYDDDVDPREHYDMGEHEDDQHAHVLRGGEREDADGDRDRDIVEEDGDDKDREREDLHEPGSHEEPEDPHELEEPEDHHEHEDHHEDEDHEEYDEHEEPEDHREHGDQDEHEEHEDHDDHDDHDDHVDHDDHDDHVDHDDHDDHDDHEDHVDQEEPEEPEEHPEESEEDLESETSEPNENNDSDADGDRYHDHDHTKEETAETDNEDEHDAHDILEDHDEDHDEDKDDDIDPQLDLPLATEEPTTQEAAGRKPTTTTDKNWLDGYPVGPEEAERGGSTEEAGPSRETEEEEEPVVVVGGGATDESSEADPLPELPSDGPEPEQDRGGDAWPGPRPRQPTPPPGGHQSQDSISYPDHTEDPALALDAEHPSDHPYPEPRPGLPEGGEDADGTVSLEGEGGERAPVEGEMGEAVCTGEDCPPPPPPTSSSRGPIVAAVIVAICAVAMVAVMGAWLYRRRQQKNSMYQLNGKDHSQCNPEQQIEMQQKV